MSHSTGHDSQLTALNTVSSIDASLIYSAEPVLGAGLAFLVLGER